MNEWMYTARERFSPDLASGWKSYVEFSGFHHVEEMITLDSMLCPDLVSDIEDEDWEHNVHQDFRITWFRDADYLRRKIPIHRRDSQILAIIESLQAPAPVPAGFRQVGFDIVDEFNGISTLTNCGPVPDIFSPSDVNRSGLLDHYDDAEQVCTRMRNLFPDDPHFRACTAWQVAKCIIETNSSDAV